MAFVTRRGGDRLNISFTPSTVPKGFGASYVAAWAAALTPAQTVPQVGDLVKIDTSANDLVKQCVASDVPYGMVWSVNSSNGTLSIVKFAATRQIILEYNGAVTIGHSVQANGTPGIIPIGGVYRNQVKDATFAAGSGVIWAVDEPRTGLLIVEFPGTAATG